SVRADIHGVGPKGRGRGRCLCRIQDEDWEREAFGLVADLHLAATDEHVGQVSLFPCSTRVSTAIQLTSQVLPPSSEKDCSKWQEIGVMSEITNRTKMARPLYISWS